MTGFIPPFPERHKKTLGPIDTLNYARRDLLSIWPEHAFERQFMAVTLVNRSIFIANCPDVIGYVLETNPGNYEKSPLVDKALKPLIGESETGRWHQQGAASFFTVEQVARCSGIMVKATEECIQNWLMLKPGATLEVLPEMHKLSADIIGRVLFGHQAHPERMARLVKYFAEYHAAVEQMGITAFFNLPKWIPNSGLGKAEKAAKNIHHLIDQMIAESTKNNAGDSLLGQLLHTQGRANEALTPGQIRKELITLFMIGHETTANSLAWAWYLISQCPEVEQRLHQEVEQVIGSGSVTHNDFSRLSYTRAILEEAMRLYPPVPILFREAAADDTIRNRPIPAGSTLLVVPWLLHRHKSYWDNPDHFIPERFLAEAPVKPKPFTYIPFSVGPNACMAKYFGTVQTTLCLAILAKHFRLQLASGQVITHECRLALRPKGNLPMQLTVRLPL